MTPRRDPLPPSPSASPPPDDEHPGVPGFHSWRGVYIFVLGVFVLVVILLTLFSRTFV